MKKITVMLFVLLFSISGCASNTSTVKKGKTEEQTKNIKKEEYKPILKKVSKEIYPDIDKLDDSLFWKQDEAIVKRYTEFSKKYMINPNLKEADLLKVSKEKDVPIGILVGTWGNDDGNIKKLRIDLRNGEKNDGFLAVNFFGNDGKDYYASYSLKDDETKFDSEKGISLNVGQTDNALKLTLKDGKLELVKLKDFGLVGLEEVTNLSYQGIKNDASKMTDMDSILSKTKQPFIRYNLSLEKNEKAHLGYFLISNRVLSTNEDGSSKRLEFFNHDILAYQIDQEKQLAKFFVGREEDRSFVTYVYKTPIDNYEVVTVYDDITEQKIKTEEFYPFGLLTDNVIPKNNDDSLYYDRGTSYVWSQKPNEPRNVLDDLSEDEVKKRVLQSYFESERITDNPFKKSLYGISSNEKASGQIIQLHAGQPQTHIILNYTINKDGEITVKEKNNISGKNIFDANLEQKSIVSTREEAIDLLKSKDWTGYSYQTKATLIFDEKELWIRRFQTDSSQLKIDDIILVSPDHVALEGTEMLNNPVTYHIYFYPDGSLKLNVVRKSSTLADLPSDEDKLNEFH